MRRYPVGHPIKINQNFDLTLQSYFGFAKVTILPPKDMYIPILPMRFKSKLMFVLCRTCANEKNMTKCKHSLEERQLTNTWCIPEIKLALAHGYELVKIHEVLHYETTSRSLFSPYISLWQKIKVEASGWPPECYSGLQLDPIKQSKYLKEYELRENIKLDPEKIKINPALRFIAKIMLNR